MKDFTLPRRDLEIKLCKCGLLAEILIRAVLFKASFSPRSGHIVEIGSALNCSHCYVGSISTKDFTLPRRDLEIKLCKCGLLAEILIRAVLFKPVFLQDQSHIVEIGSDLIVGIVM